MQTCGDHSGHTFANSKTFLNFGNRHGLGARMREVVVEELNKPANKGKTNQNIRADIWMRPDVEASGLQAADGGKAKLTSLINRERGILAKKKAINSAEDLVVYALKCLITGKENKKEQNKLVALTTKVVVSTSASGDAIVNLPFSTPNLLRILKNVLVILSLPVICTMTSRLNQAREGLKVLHVDHTYKLMTMKVIYGNNNNRELYLFVGGTTTIQQVQEGELAQ